MNDDFNLEGVIENVSDMWKYFITQYEYIVIVVINILAIMRLNMI